MKSSIFLIWLRTWKCSTILNYIINNLNMEFKLFFCANISLICYDDRMEHPSFLSILLKIFTGTWYIDIMIWGHIFSKRCKIWTTNLSLEIYRWIPLRMKEFGDKIKSFLWYLFLIDDLVTCTWNNTLQLSPSGSFHYHIITNGLRSTMFQ